LPHLQGFLSPNEGQSSLHPSLSPLVKWSSGKSEQTNILYNQEILKDQPKGKWAEELSRAIWSHNTPISRATNFTPFKLLYGEEPVTPEEIKLRSTRTRPEAIYSPSEAESKDLLEP
jgi:hypothetical protein